MKVQQLTPFILLGLLAIPVKALAHAVQTNYLLSNQLELQSTFSNGAPFKGAKVSIFAPNNPTRPWMQGVTDSQGRFAFSPDENLEGNWEVSIQQQGHGDLLRVPVGNEGVLFDLISQGPKQDIHYDTNLIAGSGAVEIALAAISH